MNDMVVVTCISNPVRYKSRYELYFKFKAMCEAAGVKLITVEIAFGNRPWVVTERDNLNHVQLRTEDELWHKENMLNLGIRHGIQVYPEATKFAWVDADVYPRRPPREWFQETAEALEHYHVVQMFEYSMDLDPDYNQLAQAREAFLAMYVKSGYNLPVRPATWASGGYDKQGHTGFAWAATRQALNGLGGLSDVSILGASDWHMAHGLVGAMRMSIPKGLHPEYSRQLMQWQERADRWVQRDVGFVGGTIDHFWHGKKADRGYNSRWKILVENQFDPSVDIKYDSQGLLVLETFSARQIRLRDQIRSYFRSRNEDSIDK